MEEGDSIYSAFLNRLSQDAGFNFSRYCKKFGRLKTNLERMNFVYRDVEKYQIYPKFNDDQKNDAESTKAREEGNESYRRGNYRVALDFYTMSILEAKSKATMALAYGNRSAALFKLELHSECLKDIDRAFENDYLSKLQSKLLDRQKLAKTRRGITLKYHEPIPKIPDSEKNSQIRCARNCIKMMKNEQYGRHVVATRDIKIGEILTVEPVYCAVIKNEVYVHCHECFQLCYNMIPCDKCTRALYCSESCKDKAYDAYHKYECPILLTLDLLTIDFPKRLALKISFLSRNEWDLSDPNLSDESEYRSDRFKEIFQLLTHTEKRSIENLLARTTVACLFFHLIKHHTTFLHDYRNEDDLKEILLSLVLNCGINTVDLNELSPIPKDSLGFYDLSTIAAAIYTFFTMFNHSCYPNVSRHYYGSSMVLRASSTIKRGEQCFVSYGPRYPSYSREFRQDFLSERHFFTCACRACEENWSTDVDLEKHLDMFMTPTVVSLRVTVDVNVAKHELKQLLIKTKKAEEKLLPGQDWVVKDFLIFCYNIFANKRRF